MISNNFVKTEVANTIAGAYFENWIDVPTWDDMLHSTELVVSSNGTEDIKQVTAMMISSKQIDLKSIATAHPHEMIVQSAILIHGYPNTTLEWSSWLNVFYYNSDYSVYGSELVWAGIDSVSIDNYELRIPYSS